MMKEEIKQIKPGEGLGPIKFGMTRENVKSIIGEPDRVDSFSYNESDDELTESWEYDDLELSVNFDHDENWKLTMISVTSEFYLLEGKSLIGLSHDKVLAELKNINLGEIVSEDFSTKEDPNQILLELDSKSLNFWISNGFLDEIQWSPEFIDEDTIKWPLI